MNYVFEMVSGAMIYSYIPNFIRIDSGIQKSFGVIHIQTHRQQGDFISILLFFRSKESRLK
jgi:hypothetical protein